MLEDWSFVLTPQFLGGTVIAGLMLNIVGAYVVRVIDCFRVALPAFYRRTRNEESVRIELLTAAATSDNALYAALAAEDSRLRLRQLLHFFIAFICIFTFLFLFALGMLKHGLGVPGLVLVTFLVGMAGAHYSLGVGIGPRTRRLGIVLNAVQRNRGLPILD